jgi:hypothetical protein
MTANDGLAIVVVPQDAIEAARQPGEAYRLTGAVADFVNGIQDLGVYARHEIPAVAMHAYNADYYLAQVNNGGHSQFIRNTGVALLPSTTVDALAGLEAMGAQAQRQILAEMIAWLEANPEEAAAQNGFSVRAAALDALDDRFYEAERKAPIAELSAEWIAGWPELRPVAREQYSAAIEAIAQLNPHLTARRIWQAVQQLRHQMTDHLQITVAAACGAVKPEPEPKFAVGAGSQMEIEGSLCTAFGVNTTKGMRVCVYEDAGGRLYEYILRSPVPKLENLKLEDVTSFQRPVVGARLSTVDADTIRRFVKAANETQAPEAIDLLLRKAGLDPKAAITAWQAFDGAASWIIAAGQDLIAAATTAQGAVLLKPDQTPILSVSRKEIERHAKEAAAGRESLEPSAKSSFDILKSESNRSQGLIWVNLRNALKSIFSSR